MLPSAFRFYLANTEGNDPNLRRGLLRCDAGSTLLIGQMPFRIRITADADSISFQRYNSANMLDGPSHDFPFGTEPVGDHLRVVVVAVTPQHDHNGLSYIVYRNERINDWHYYHGVPEIYVSDRLDIVADEEAFSYNGRDSANFQSPPHVGYASALVRQHQRTPNSWFEELLNRDHVVTGQRVHVLAGGRGRELREGLHRHSPDPTTPAPGQHLRLAGADPGPDDADGSVLRQLHHPEGAGGHGDGGRFHQGRGTGVFQPRGGADTG